MTRSLSTEKRKRRPKPGSRPGEISVDSSAASTRLTVIRYDATDLTELPDFRIDGLSSVLDKESVAWLDVTGLGDRDTLESVGRAFGIHPLALADVVNVPQRPKVEAYGDLLFIVVQLLTDTGKTAREQLGIFLGPRFVVTFQERPGDPFEPVRQRLRQGTGRLRHRGPDYLAYALLDAAIDGYFPALGSLQDRLEALESSLRLPQTMAIDMIRFARADLTEVRQTIGPLKDVVRSLSGSEWPHIDEATRTFLRDCRDHVLEASEQLEICREIAQGLMDVHLSTMNHQANQTMKILTVIATIFMPLSFLAGVYGMNFNPQASQWNMPELNSPIGYPLVLAVMAAVGLGLLFVFWRKKWFE